MKNQYQLQRCFAFSKLESRKVKSEPLYLLPCRICTTRRQIRMKIFAEKRRARIFYGMWCNKPRQGASRYIRRKLFCKEVIEEDSLNISLQASRAGIAMVTASVMRIAFLLLHVFVVWRRFPWRGFSFNPRARSQYCSQRVSFYKFSLYSGRTVVERAWRRAPHSVHVKHKTRRCTCGSVRTDWYESNIRPKIQYRGSAQKGSL